eukprot:gene850-biopygen113
MATAQLDCCLNICSELGVPIAPGKTVGPATTLTYLGFELDTVLLELRMPPTKITVLRKKLQQWLSGSPGTKRQLLSLIGYLQHCCHAIVPGRPFLRRLIDCAHGVKDLRHSVKLSSEALADLLWWQRLLTACNGKSLFLYNQQTPVQDISISSDAAGSLGFAAINGLAWFAQPWPKGCENLSIAVKELIPIVLAAYVWGPTWSRLHVLFKCDNMAVVECLSRGLCKDRHLALLLRDLSIQAILHSFSFSAIHVPGAVNTLADLLSRLRFQQFLHRLPLPEPHSPPVPPIMLHRLLSPP